MKEIERDMSRVVGFAFASLGEETSGRKRKGVGNQCGRAMNRPSWASRPEHQSAVTTGRSRCLRSIVVSLTVTTVTKGISK